MAEENQMTEENKKTIIAFIAGLLVGGLLVFIFANPSESTVETDEQDDTTEENVVETTEDEAEDATVEEEDEGTTPATPEMDEEDSGVSVDNQDAGSTVTLRSVSFPTNEGWVAIRDYENGQLGGILGAARWNKLTALLPSSVKLLRPTVSGNTYAVVF